MEDVEHKPHSYWFDRYPAVIESTIFWPDLDFKFRNNTEHGVLIDTSYTSSTITVSIWSTKIYDSVKTEYGPRRNITTPKLIHLEPGPSCIATNGINGFTQDAFRVIKKGGEVVKREKFTWRYDAEPRLRLRPETRPDPRSDTGPTYLARQRPDCTWPGGPRRLCAVAPASSAGGSRRRHLTPTARVAGLGSGHSALVVGLRR